MKSLDGTGLVVYIFDLPVDVEPRKKYCIHQYLILFAYDGEKRKRLI